MIPKAAATLAAFAGWGAAGAILGSLVPGLGFLIGLAVGVGIMLFGSEHP